MQKFRYKTIIDSRDNPAVGDLLSTASGLPRDRIDEALGKGALWLRRRNMKALRLREPGFRLRRGDMLEFQYDETILRQIPPKALLVADEEHYSVWNKPPGLLTQGTPYGDHCSLLRQVELHFTPPRPAHPVHRLDREVSGLILVAHGSRAAAAFSGLIRRGGLHREYRALLRGNPDRCHGKGSIDIPLDGRTSITEFQVIAYNEERDVSEVSVRPGTGRLHQIRRHFDMIGCPVIGDPRYGRGNKNREGLRLEASVLTFICPCTGQEKSFSINSEMGFL